MVYFCLQVSFNFVCEPLANICTLANSKNYYGYLLVTFCLYFGSFYFGFLFGYILVH